MVVVKHYFRDPTPLEHAIQLSHGSGCIRCVMQHSVRIDYVKALIGKRQSLAIGHQKSARLIVQAEAMACDFDGARRKVDTGATRAAPCKLQQICPHATTDFE